jgi:D-amino-acid dehydrogenase
MEASRSDVLILGGGVIGLSCALYLLKAGASVRVLEQGTPGCGSSHGNCGTITPSHASPLTMPGTIGIALASLLRRDAPLYLNPRPNLERMRWLLGFARHCTWAEFRRAGMARGTILKRSRGLLADLIASESLDCEFAETGELYVYRTMKALATEKAHVDLLGQMDIDIQYKTADDVLTMEPTLKSGVVGGLYHPGDASLRPDRFVSELARRVRELGGSIESGARIDGFTTAEGKVTHVRTTRGVFSGERVVMALGAWSPLLGQALDLRLPMQPGKGYSITYAQPPALVPRISLVLREASVCVTAWSSGFRLGSTMEFSGYAEGLNQIRLDALRRGAAQYLHQPEGLDEGEPWWGWRPMSVDEVPIVGASSRWSNLILATGHGMLGVSMSAATGELVAALVRGATPAIDPAPYAPARFGI